MAEKKVMNRWLVVIGAIMIQLCLGAIYAWSAFTKNLTESPFSFSITQTQVIFSIGLVTFAVVMALVAGKWQAKAGPRKVALTGGIVMGLGYILAGLSGNSFVGILIGVGILGGAGIGLGYVCPIAACVKWFPDKKGLITGLAVAGFGFGALIWIKLTTGFQFGPIDLTPGWKGLFGAGWSVGNVFILYGVLFAVIVGLGSIVMVNPPEGWKPEGWNPESSSAVKSSGKNNFAVGEMIRTPQFWGLFSIFTVGATCGLMVIGVIKLFGIDALTANGFEAAKANVITGTAMGLFYSLFNGLGRIAWGWFSDRMGRKNAIVTMTALQGVTMIVFYFIGKNEFGIYLAASVIGFNFGGNFALFPAATADFFGNKSVGTNYPWVFMAYGLGGLIGPILGGAMGDARVWSLAFIPTGIACLLAAGIGLLLKQPAIPVKATVGTSQPVVAGVK